MLHDRLQTARRSLVRHAVAAERAGFSAHEQALTEVLLTRAAPAVHVWAFSHRDEATTGADWLWWWRGGGEWFGALVQAKRHKPRLGNPWYDFGYRSGSGQLQVDRLLTTSRSLGVPAVYLLYNHPALSRSVSLSMPCCALVNEAWRTRLRVAVLPALVARSLIGSEDLAPQFCRPVECLACAGLTPPLLPAIRATITDRELIRFLRGTALTVPRIAARGLLAQIAQMRMGQFRKVSADVGTPVIEADDQLFLALPDDTGHFGEPYFEHVLRGLRTRPPAYVAAALEGARAEQLQVHLEGVEGLVVIGDPEEE